ncbi:MAG: HDOD domain-containing protein [Desulfurivibrionaceae bacterium]
MVFDQRKVDLFDDKMKLVFFQELAKWSAQECCDLAVLNKQLLVSNQRAKKRLYEVRVQSPDDYRNSPLIRGMIEKIPRLPLFVHTLTSRLMDENATVSQIADIIQRDPSLTADVLRKVNSPYYGLGSKISDISSAVLFMGFETLYQVAISEGLRRSMPETAEFEDIHAQALATSQMLFSMSRTTGISIPVRMATIGLLHNLGQSVGELFIKKNPDYEMMVNLIDQSQLGALLLVEWELPEAICRAVQYQDYPEFAPPAAIPEDVVDNVTLLYFAKLCYKLLCGTSESKLSSVYTEEYKSRFGWDGLPINEILKKYVMVDLMKKINTLPEFIRQLFYNFRDS